MTLDVSSDCALDAASDCAPDAEARYREIVDGLPDQVVAIDRALRCTAWNRASERATGIEAAAALGRSLYEVFPTFAGTDLERAVLAVIATGEPREVAQGVALRGVPHHVRVRIAPTSEGASILSRDVTDLVQSAAALRQNEARYRELADSERQTREALRASEERFRAIFEQAPVGIAVTNSRTGRYIEMNERHASMVGRSREELLASDWRSITHPDDIAADAASMADLVRGDIPGFRMEKRYLKPDGTGTWVSMTVVQMLTGRLDQPHTLTIVEDITERKTSQEALHASEERFRALFHNGPLNSVVYRFVRDPAGEIVDWEIVSINAGGAAAIGLPQDELPGRRALELFGLEAMAGYLEVSREIARTGVPRTTEVHFAFNDRDYLAAVFLVGDDLYANVSIDITDLRRTQARLERAERVDLVGRLASGVAHDFNNLLVAITGYAELIGDTFLEDDPRREDVEAVLEAATRASTLTRRLLVFGHHQPFEAAVVDVDGLVGGLGAVLRSLAGGRVELCVRRASRAPLVRADRAQIEQVVVNLVVNARDAMAHGGRVTIETTHVDVEAGDDRRSPPPDPGEYVRLTVTDTGTGIDAATLAHIFEPFFSTKSVGQGTGLGLSIVAEAVARAGGFVTVESEPGVGTRFAVHLRAAEPEAEASPASVARPKAAGGTETLLLVDDEPRVRAVTARLLRERGYSVVEAPSAAIALAIVEREAAAIDLLLTDVAMPGESGFDLADRLTALRPGLPVLFISAYAPQATADHARVVAEGSYLAKPFGRDELATRVRALLDHAKGRSG